MEQYRPMVMAIWAPGITRRRSPRSMQPGWMMDFPPRTMLDAPTMDACRDTLSGSQPSPSLFDDPSGDVLPVSVSVGQRRW